MPTAKELIEAAIGEGRYPRVKRHDIVKAVLALSSYGSDVLGTLFVDEWDYVNGEKVLYGNFRPDGPGRRMDDVFAGWDPHDRIWRVSDNLEDIAGPRPYVHTGGSI